jgi:hypothetical protein
MVAAITTITTVDRRPSIDSTHHRTRTTVC